MDNDNKILEDNDWIIECESPFEIAHLDSNSSATNWAADAVLSELKNADVINDLKLLKKAYAANFTNEEIFIKKAIALIDKLN